MSVKSQKAPGVNIPALDVIFQVVEEAGALLAALWSTAPLNIQSAAAAILHPLQYCWLVWICAPVSVSCIIYNNQQRKQIASVCVHCLFVVYATSPCRICPDRNFLTRRTHKFLLSSPTLAVESLLFFLLSHCWRIFLFRKDLFWCTSIITV